MAGDWTILDVGAWLCSVVLLYLFCLQIVLFQDPDPNRFVIVIASGFLVSMLRNVRKTGHLLPL